MKFNTHNDTDERDSLDLRNKTIKRIQDVQRHKYWANFNGVGPPPAACIATRFGIELIETPYAVLRQMGPQILNSQL
ncbi:hypothetical protein TNCV_186941 [Trichonephila clavipes]|nr:hypothetical protein TNCV_186941 [Trichonephila clavipes]